MALDLDKINGLLNIVKEAAGHPTKLAALGTLAMKELEGHNADAKKAHDEIIKAENEEAAAKQKALDDAEAKRLANEEALKQQNASAGVQADGLETVRRKVPAEVE
jgi:hypothetical protein